MAGIYIFYEDGKILDTVLVKFINFIRSATLKFGLKPCFSLALLLISQTVNT